MLSFVVAVNKFFGKKEGQTLRDFAGEIKTLTEEDKNWFAKELTRELKEEVEIK